MRWDGLIVITLMLLPLVIMEGSVAYIFWIVVTGAYIAYIAHKTRELVSSK
ncbi:MAG: hypothetical protein ACLFVX_02465 [Archaeoglobaceae archaeon]